MEKEIISQDLLDILACPVCKEGIELIEYKKDEYGLKCSKCNKVYPIRDGIPVMLVEEALPYKAE
ncbi:MAG TPA: Trm112 family protein [Candidatus Kapabacteria bacterium]|nr:Trm112 family protein [Candidatus Kapabacteria bacterium]